MMRYVYCVMLLLVTWCLGDLVTPALAESVTSTQLIESAAQFDSQRVSFQGEAIGDIMARGAYAWVNVNDGANAIGIWVSKDLTEGIAFTGSYKAKGDIVAAEGIFHRACLEHGGDMDIHATTLVVVAPGQRVAERPDAQKKQIALVLTGVLCLVVILQLLKKK